MHLEHVNVLWTQSLESKDLDFVFKNKGSNVIEIHFKSSRTSHQQKHTNILKHACLQCDIGMHSSTIKLDSLSITVAMYQGRR